VAEPAQAPAGGGAAPRGPAGRFAIHVASVRDPARVAEEWRRLAGRHPSLAGLALREPRTVEVPGRGRFYRVIAGAFASRAEAEAACARLGPEGRGCRAVAY
jgi:sporulation related protein